MVRGNRDEVGLGSWRKLRRRFKMKTLQSTLVSQHKEMHPKGTSKISEMPQRILDWDNDLKNVEKVGSPPYQ